MANAPTAGPTVPTVRGPVPVEHLGRTLAHEHVIVRDAEFAALYPDLGWPGGTRETALDATVRRLGDIRASGIDTIIDCTALLHGRDLAFVQEVNARVDINIVMSTGIYTYDHLPHYLEYRPHRGRDLMTEMFVRDLTGGIGDSGVRANMIKVAAHSQGVTENVAAVLGAAATAAQHTGAAITLHTHPPSGSDVAGVAALIAAGADPERIIVGHAGDSADLDHLRRFVDAGSTIASDRFGLYIAGTPGEAERVRIIAALCAEGYADRIVLGHDTMLCHDWGDRVGAGHDDWVGSHVGTVIVPALRAAGVGEQDLTAMLVGTPARLLTGGA